MTSGRIQQRNADVGIALARAQFQQFRAKIRGTDECGTVSTNLEGLLAHYLDVSPRRRKSKIELKLEGQTDAYVFLILAWGFARSGDEHRAGQLVEQARELLTPHLDDPVHATAMSKYLAQLGEPSDVAPTLSTIQEFKLRRLLDSSVILEHDGVDAFAWWMARKDMPLAESSSIRPDRSELGEMLRELQRNHDEYTTTGRKSYTGIERAAGYRVSSHQPDTGADVNAFYRAIIRNLAWSDWTAVEHSCATIVDELLQSLVDTTDRMSTNTHFCLAVIFRMEVLVRLLLMPDVVQP
jgi:hypothetical protein